MMQSRIPWFPWIRRWLSERNNVPAKARRPRRLLVESLEDRTGLSTTPITIAPLAQHRPATEEQPSLLAPFTPVIDGGIDDKTDAIDTEKNLPTAAPADQSAFNPTAGDRPPLTPPWKGGESDQRLEDEAYQNGTHQPVGVTTIQSDVTGTPQRPILLARAAYEALSREAGSKEPANIPSTDSYFQIQRTPVTQQSLEVQYEVRAYTNSGALARQQTAVFAAGSGQIDVTDLQLPVSRQGNVEIITLTLHAQKQYQISQPAATIIVASEAQPCSEEALLRASQEGKSPVAMTALVEMHRPRVLQTCYSVLGNMADAEDACQLVFIMFAQQHYKLQQTVGRWLHAVARNVAISFLRARQRRRRHEQKAMKADLLPASTNDELREEIDQALTQIPLQLRQAVKLRYLDGWSQEEAAEILGWPRGTLAQRAAKGLQALRKVMSPAEAGLVH